MIGASGILVSLRLENWGARKQHINLLQVPSNLDSRIAGSLETLEIWTLGANSPWSQATKTPRLAWILGNIQVKKTRRSQRIVCLVTWHLDAWPTQRSRDHGGRQPRTSLPVSLIADRAVGGQAVPSKVTRLAGAQKSPRARFLPREKDGEQCPKCICAIGRTVKRVGGADRDRHRGKPQVPVAPRKNKNFSACTLDVDATTGGL